MYMTRKSWRQTLGDAAVSGTISGAATAAAAAACGARDSGSAVAAINAVSHILWGSEASNVRVADAKHTASGLVLNEGAGILWAAVYERLFGNAAERGDVAKAFGGAGAVAALAYVVDYHVVPKRLTPGWEERVSGRSLALIYAALALSLPLRGLFQSRRTRRGT
jgi:hypothetical protein